MNNPSQDHDCLEVFFIKDHHPDPTFPGQLDLFLRDPGTFSTLPLGEEPLAEWQLWMTYSLKNLAMELHC